MEADRVASADATLKIHNENSDTIIRIGCLRSTFSSWVKDDDKPYLAPRHKIYALQEPFKKTAGNTKEHQISAPLGVDDPAKWCNSFVILP